MRPIDHLPSSFNEVSVIYTIFNFRGRGEEQCNCTVCCIGSKHSFSLGEKLFDSACIVMKLPDGQQICRDLQIRHFVMGDSLSNKYAGSLVLSYLRYPVTLLNYTRRHECTCSQLLF
jgi:hypothetical protein